MKLKAKKYTLLTIFPLLIACAPVQMILSALLNMTIGVLPVLSALSTAWFIDSALSLAAGTLAWGDMALPTACVVLIQTADYCRWQLDNFSMETIKINLLRAYRPMLTAKAASLKYECIEDGKTWDLISRMCSDPVEKVGSILDGTVYLAQLSVGLIGVLILVAAQVWWAAAIIAALFVPVIFVSLKVGAKSYEERAMHERQKRRFENDRNICIEREFAEERAAFGYGEEVARRYTDEFDDAYKYLFRYFRRRETTMAVLESMFVLIVVGTAVALAFPAMRGAISVGTLVAVIREVLSMTERIGGLHYCMKEIGEGRAYAKDMTAFANLPEQEDALCAAGEAPEFESLEFRHVSFAYPGTERRVLDDFSLKLERGKHYAFVGVNGAGKTTMTKLILGLYDRFEGEILLNGRDVREYSQAQLKGLCSVIFQDFARYQTKMRESITLGDARCEERLEAAVEAAGLGEAVDRLKNGMDTPLGKVYESGQDLSGGQWQRLAIARTLVRNSPLRILDEPTAALDPVSESEFYAHFGELSQGVTTLFISHRLGSTKLADRIFVMDGGKIAEEGTQEELIAKGGLYAEMYEAQRSWYE